MAASLNRRLASSRSMNKLGRQEARAAARLTRPRGGHIHRQLDLKAAQQGIYAHVAAASVPGKPGQLVAVEIAVAVTRTIAVLQEEQLEGPLAEALELVPDDDGAIDSTRCGGSGSRAG